MFKNIVKFSLYLAVLLSILGYSLSKVYVLAKPNIEKQQKLAEQSAKLVIYPNATKFSKKIKKINNENFVYEEVYDENNRLIGYIVKTSEFGYSSDVISMVGFNKDLKIDGIFVLSQAETPGLGARVQEVISNKYLWTSWKKSNGLEEKTPWFQEQFKGVNALKIKLIKGKEWKDLTIQERENLRNNNEITALSGATITSNAVLQSVKLAAQKLKVALELNNSPSIDTLQINNTPDSLKNTSKSDTLE